MRKQPNLFMYQSISQNPRRFNQKNFILNLKCGEQEVKVDLIQQEVSNGYT